MLSKNDSELINLKDKTMANKNVLYDFIIFLIFHTLKIAVAF